MDSDDIDPKLVFTRERHGEKITLSVSHDRAKSIFGHSGRDLTGLEMPGEFWSKVIPAVVALMDERERAELMKGIAERIGVDLYGGNTPEFPPGLQVYQGECGTVGEVVCR